MHIYDLSGPPPAPAGIHVTTGAFAYSKTGVPLGTNGLMNCIGVVLHDPTSRRGCLGHLTPDLSDTVQKLSDFFTLCFQLMEVAQQPNIQVVVMGGMSRDAAFVQNFTQVLNQHAIPIGNCFDARTSKGIQAPFIGTRVAAANQAIYSPHDEATWVSGNITGIPPYDNEAQTQESIIQQGSLQGLKSIVGAVLGTV